MLGKRVWRQTPTVTINSRGMVLLVLCVFFGVGAILGWFFSLVGGERESLRGILSSYFQRVAQEGMSSSPMVAVWELIRWPVIAFVLGMSGIGLVAIPLLVMTRARGFLLSYSATAFVMMFGTDGLVVNGIFLGISSFFMLPVLLYLSQCMVTYQLRRRLSSQDSGGFSGELTTLLPCLFLSGVAFVAQHCMIPMMLPWLGHL